MQEFIKMARTLALTVLVSLGMITLNFSNVFAVGFDGQPISAYSGNEYRATGGGHYISWTYNNIQSNISEVYAFMYVEDNRYNICVICNGTYGNITFRVDGSQTGVANIYTAVPNASGYYYSRDWTRNTYTYGLTMYSSLNDGLTAFANYSPIPPQVSKYTFQNGWLSVIDLGASNTAYNFDLSTSFNVNSGIVSQKWSETSQTYWFSDNLPTVDSSYTNQGTLVPWERGTSRNVFGQTKDGIYNLSGTSTGRYLYILNPAFRAIADAEHPSIENHSVTVSGLTNGMKAYVYELTATATLSGVANAISTIEVDGQTVIANSGSVTAGDTSEDLTNSFVNSDNETIVQNQGGGNQNTTAQTINNYLENIQNVLDNFVNQFVGLLTAPISHIQQLVSAGTSFFTVFGQLFTSWMPTEISSVIISALVVMVVIGVIKMLL